MDFNEIWYSQTVGSVKLFLNTFKQRLHDNFIQNWNSRLENSTRALFYNKIKSFEFQSYLDICNILKFKVALAKLRVSSHRLEIEAGRWAKPRCTPIDERKCKLCNILEDEYHFAMECELYTDIRRQLIKTYYRIHPSMFKFTALMNTSSKIELKNLATYVFRAYEIRDSFLLDDNIISIGR